MTTDDPLGSTFFHTQLLKGIDYYRLLIESEHTEVYTSLVFNSLKLHGIQQYATVWCVFRSHTMHIYTQFRTKYVCIFSLLASCCAASVIIPHIYTDEIAKILKICNSTPAQPYHLSYAQTEPIVL